MQRISAAERTERGVRLEWANPKKVSFPENARALLEAELGLAGGCQGGFIKDRLKRFGISRVFIGASGTLVVYTAQGSTYTVTDAGSKRQVLDALFDDARAAVPGAP